MVVLLEYNIQAHLYKTCIIFNNLNLTNANNNGIISIINNKVWEVRLVATQSCSNKTGKIAYKGKLYNTKKELAEGYNIKPNTLRRRISVGLSLDEAVNTKRVGSIVYNKVTYKGLLDLCDKLGICYSTLRRKLDNGLEVADGVNECLKIKDRNKYTLHGKKYGSLASIAKDYGVSRQFVSLKVKQGLTLEELFPNPPLE